MALDASRILFVHGSGMIGGSERVLITITNQLVHRGIRPIVVCPSQSPLQRELAACAVEIRDASFPAWRKFKTFFTRGKSIRSLESIIESVQPQLISINGRWWVPQVLRASRRVAVPVVAHVHEEITPFKVRLYELNQVDLVLAVSKQIQHSLEAGGIPSRQIKLLYSGLELKRFFRDMNGSNIRKELRLSDGVVVIGTVANLLPIKGYDVMLQAMPLIHAKVPHTHYLIIGTGDNEYEQQLHRQVKQLGLEEFVHFLGFQQDVSPYLATLDVYVHPARTEGLPIAGLEAMAMYKPVVATDVGGLSEAVQHQRTGLLVKSDDANALAQAVLALLSDPERRRVFGAEGRRRVEARFTVEAMMDGLLQSYQYVLRPQ